MRQRVYEARQDGVAAALVYCSVVGWQRIEFLVAKCRVGRHDDVRVGGDRGRSTWSSKEPFRRRTRG